MGVLHQHPPLQQLLGDLPAGAVPRGDVDAGPQPTPTHRRHPPRPGQRAQLPQQMLTELRRPLLELTRPQNRDHLQRHRTGQRVPAERRPVLPGPEHPQHIRRRHHRRHRHDPTAERLAEQIHIRHHPLVLAREGTTRASEPRLDLVRHEQHVPLPRQLPHRRQISGRRNEHPRLPLDRFQQHGDRVLRQRLAHRREIPVRHDLEARRVRTEVRPRLRVGGEADDRRRTAVEVVARDHDLRHLRRHSLDPVPPLPRGLHGRLHRLRARVHREHHLHAAQLRELLAERCEPVVVKRPRRQRHPLQLRLRRRQNPPVAVPEVQRRVPGQQIQIPPPLHVRHPRPVRRGHHDRQRLIGVRGARVGGGDQGFGGARPTHGALRSATTRARAVAVPGLVATVHFRPFECFAAPFLSLLA